MNEVTIHPDEAQLLLYLANELSTPQRQELEARLAEDRPLRDRLDSLRDIDAVLNQSLAGLDAAEPIETSVRAVERQMSRTFRQWQVDRGSRKVTPPSNAKVRRVPIWLYPLATAALVLVCLGVWYLSFDRNADGTLALNDESDLPRAPTWDVPDEDEPTPDLELAATDGDSFGDLEEEMINLVSLSRALQ